MCIQKWQNIIFINHFLNHFLNHLEVFFLNINTFFDPKRIKIHHILWIFSLDYNVVEVKYGYYLVKIFEGKILKFDPGDTLNKVVPPLPPIL